MTKYEMKDAILDCTFGENDNVAYCGGLDCAVMRVDLPSGASQQMGSHIADTSVRCVNYCGFNNTVLSGGWDGHIMQWDPRQKDPCVADVLTRSGHRVYTMDVSESKLVVGLSDRVVHIYDVRKLDTPEQERESSIANQTRCLRCSPDGNGFVMGTIEGRVAVEFLDPSPKVQVRVFVVTWPLLYPIVLILRRRTSTTHHHLYCTLTHYFPFLTPCRRKSMPSNATGKRSGTHRPFIH